jgi:DNA-binding CsgD family transcriptional regulator
MHNTCIEDASVPCNVLLAGRRHEVDGGARLRLIGRSYERQALDRMLDTLRGGQSSTLVVHGERGVGKTALLEYVRDRATECQVVSASALRSESELAVGGLHQLCASLLDRRERLPAPQRFALETAFGLTEGLPRDRFFLALAALSLLSEGARERPLICLVDDAQWLDRVSAQVLGFVARRISETPVALVVAARQPSAWMVGLPEMRVRGLADGDARKLLGSALRGPLDQSVAERVIAETRGNPLAVLESARGLTPAQLAGGFGDPDAGCAPGFLGKRFARSLAALSEETRLLLLLAAAEPLGDPRLLGRAVERLGIPLEAVDAARSAALLDIGSHVRFAHPLLRSAIYRSGTPQNLRTVHAALAEVTDPRLDPERCAWHRARGVSAPDEDVAAELERLAARAGARGGLAATSSFLLKAAALTSAPAQRARRALAAAEAARLAGDPDAALRAVVSAEAGQLDSLGHARAELLRARLAFDAGVHDAVTGLVEVANRLYSLDVDLAREAHLEALAARVQVGPGHAPMRWARAVVAAPRPRQPGPMDLLFDGVATQFTKGHPAAAQRLRAAVSALADQDTPDRVALMAGWLAARVAAVLWEHDLQRTLAKRHVRHAQDTGALAVLPEALVQLIEIHLREGSRASADARLQQLDAALDAPDSEQSVRAAALIGAYRGREEEGRRLIAAARTNLSPESRGASLLAIEFAELLLDTGLGQCEAALPSCRRVLEDVELVGLAPWALPELVEAATRSGAMSEARAALHELERSAHISNTDWALGVQARSRALLRNGGEAEQLYLEAITRLGTTSCRVDLARAHLLYGEWLRREGRRVDARQHLRVAHEMLSGMGVEAFAQRARRELSATCGKARKRVVETHDYLTPQEEEIARLARDGLSNPEIGTRLFLSPRTVEWHLRKIFIKLGITSRFALREALPEENALRA